MKRFKCLVEGCGHVTKTRNGVATHIKRLHEKGVVLGETYETTRDAVTNPNRNGPHKAKKHRSTARAVPVITTETRHIDIPCIIRISVEGLKVQGLVFSNVTD